MCISGMIYKLVKLDFSIFLSNLSLLTNGWQSLKETWVKKESFQRRKWNTSQNAKRKKESISLNPFPSETSDISYYSKFSHKRNVTKRCQVGKRSVFILFHIYINIRQNRVNGPSLILIIKTTFWKNALNGNGKIWNFKARNVKIVQLYQYIFASKYQVMHCGLLPDILFCFALQVYVEFLCGWPIHSNQQTFNNFQ